MGTALVVGPAGGLAVDRWGTAAPLFSGLVVMAGGLALLLGAGPGTPYGRLLLAFLAVGVGCEMLSTTTNVMALEAIGREKAGQASGMLSFFRRGGGLLGVVLAALVFSLVARDELTARLDRPPPLPAVTHARLEADLGAYASDAQFSRSHRGVGARVVRQGSATGFGSVVLLCLLVVVVPIKLAPELLAHASEHAEWEEFSRMRLAEGGDLRKYYPLSEAARAEYEAWRREQAS